jgi:hypothetical protein
LNPLKALIALSRREDSDSLKDKTLRKRISSHLPLKVQVFKVKGFPHKQRKKKRAT